MTQTTSPIATNVRRTAKSVTFGTTAKFHEHVTVRVTKVDHGYAVAVKHFEDSPRFVRLAWFCWGSDATAFVALNYFTEDSVTSYTPAAYEAARDVLHPLTTAAYTPEGTE